LIQGTEDELKLEERSQEPDLKKLTEAKEIHTKLQAANERSGVVGYFHDPEKDR